MSVCILLELLLSIAWPIDLERFASKCNDILPVFYVKEKRMNSRKYSVGKELEKMIEEMYGKNKSVKSNSFVIQSSIASKLAALFIIIRFMGVSKLWELLLTIARPMDIDQLAGKVLAVDASIWIVKIDSLYNSNSEKLKSILSKIMMLKRNNILPVFVFDGVAPALKRKTLEERYQKRLVAGEMQAKKKSEIEIMKMIEGGEASKNRLSEKSRRIQKNEQELSQLNKTLKNLSEFQEKADREVSNQLIEKISLQSEILNTKYKIMLELNPKLNRYKYFISLEEYETLDLERKIDFLDQLQEYKWKHVKQDRAQSRKNLSEEDKLMKDLQVIEKRSVIREMQDNLFRKMMQKNVKVEDGFEIIETIYNGRKITQKRKIKEENSNSFGIGMKKGKMKNDLNCLNFREGKLESDEEQDDFLAEFCSTAISKPNMEASPETEIVKPLNDLHIGKANKEKKKEYKKQGKKENKKQKIRKNNSASEREQSAEVYVPFQNYLKSQVNDQPEEYVNKAQLEQRFSQRQPEDEEDNRDNLPTYMPNQGLLYINYSNDNLELQNLLKVLGIPFIIAPAEAEAQCAALQEMGIVDGIITEDSDTFLFGGKNVFRGVFQGNIRYYSFKQMQEKLKLTREKLIIFALLLGSDYTGGVKGVGLVNAMQILKVFNTFEKLQQFKKWARLPDVLLPQEETTSELLRHANRQQMEFYQLHRKFKNYWYVEQQFGNNRVKNAYLSPEVIAQDQILELKRQDKFQPGPCNTEILQKLLKEKLQLQPRELQHFMKLLTLQFTKQQKTLKDYFSQEGQMARVRSKRLQKSLESLNGD